MPVFLPLAGGHVVAERTDFPVGEDPINMTVPATNDLAVR